MQKNCTPSQTSLPESSLSGVRTPLTFCQSYVIMTKRMWDTTASEEESILLRSQFKMGYRTSAGASWSSGKRVPPMKEIRYLCRGLCDCFDNILLLTRDNNSTMSLDGAWVVFHGEFIFREAWNECEVSRQNSVTALLTHFMQFS